MTATSRPDIIERTIQSFTRNLIGIDYQEVFFLINLDNVPHMDHKEIEEKIESIMIKYCPYYMLIIQDTPNFTAAINRLWYLVNAEYIFHLEDDWLLMETVHIDKLVEYFNKNPNLMQVALRAYDYEYNKLVLSPSLIHRRAFKSIAKKLDESQNPEIQLRGENFGIFMPTEASNNKGLVTAYPFNKSHIIVKDIGRSWIKKTEYQKPDKKFKFTSWVKK
jgi:GT2 family glycosyltransferase